MRFSALVPILLITASLVLAFLCLFAGSNKGFLESYAVLTLNTSRIGYDVLEGPQLASTGLTTLINAIPDSIRNDLESDVNNIARDIGIHDWYSYHLMDYCEGYYVPTPIPNNTVPLSEIHKNVTQCSNRTALFAFDPRTIIQQELNNSLGSGAGSLLNDIQWPDDIDTGIRALQTAAKAAFVLYCIAIGLIGVALILAILCIFAEGRVSALLNMMFDWLAFLAIGIASALTTVIAVKGASVINQYGDDVGVSAQQGNNFLVLTWVSTGCILLASIVWCFDCIFGGRRSSPSKEE